MPAPLNVTQSIHIEAPPETVWSLITDLGRMGQWSPETRETRWLGGATGPEVGARFQGFNRQGWLRWFGTCDVTEVEPGRRFVFVRSQGGLGPVGLPVPDGGCTWSYVLEPEGSGTRLTESAAQRHDYPTPVRQALRVMMGDRNAVVARGIQTTLERVKAAAEASVAQPVGNP
jgi:uncharacterized protein YndB with AHSA1/START domain